MKSLHLYLVNVLLFIVTVNLSCIAQIDYFGETPPGNTAKIFAPGIISKVDRFEARMVYSPDGNEIFFAIENSSNSDMSILTSRKKEGVWSPQVVAPFSGEAHDFEPCYSPNGNRLYFTSKRQTGYFKLWYVNRIDTTWSEPVKMPEPVNTTSLELFSNPVNDSVFYFVSSRPGGYGSTDLYVVEYDTTVQPFHAKAEPVNLGKTINTSASEYDACPHPSGDYIIFMRNGDLYISFRKADNTFTYARNMGPNINTNSTEVGPVITPDTNYLMFTRFLNNVGDIYWVSLSIVDSLKNSNFSPYVNKKIQNTSFLINEHFEISLPDSAFIDDDEDDTLIYSASLSNNDALPGWMPFDPVTKILSGTAPETGNFTVKIKARDNDAAEAYFTFNIAFTSPTSWTDPQAEKWICYPNPAHNKVYFQTTDEFSLIKVEIMDSCGRICKKTNLSSTRYVDIEGLNAGIYFVRIMEKQQSYIVRLIVE